MKGKGKQERQGENGWWIAEDGRGNGVEDEGREGKGGRGGNDKGRVGSRGGMQWEFSLLF